MELIPYTHSGFLLINKPAGKTSTTAVSRIKWIIKQAGFKAKIGHSGTLDSFATGLLIIGIGREATRELGALLGAQKTYKATAKLGEETDTLEKTGAIISQKSFEHISQHNLEEAARTLQPSYFQTPPLYSALKHEGSAISSLVRSRKMSDDQLSSIIEGKQREVKIFDLTILNCKLPFFTFEATVSKGTYIRSLANDIAQRCGSCATTYALERVAIENIQFSSAISLDEIKTEEDIRNNLVEKEMLISY